MIKNKIYIIGTLLLILFSISIVWADEATPYVFFDLARISAPIHGNQYLNGWILTGMGMFIAFTCLLITMLVVKYLPYALKILDFIIPEKIVQDAKIIQNAKSETNEAIAAAIAVAYHNHNNDRR